MPRHNTVYQIRNPWILPRAFVLERLDTDCIVCGDSMGTLTMFNGLHHHGSNTCSTCYQGWIDGQVTSKPWNQICCPECQEVLPYEIVRAMVSSPLLERSVNLDAFHVSVVSNRIALQLRSSICSSCTELGSRLSLLLVSCLYNRADPSKRH